jgi:ABC-type transport system involved in cytochrome c biogenesis permease subunit
MRLELYLLWTAIVAYVFSGSAAIGGVVLGKRPERFVLGLMLLGLALHTAAIGVRWERLGHGPFVTMYEILSSNVWSLMLAFSLAYWRLPPIRAVAAVVMPVLFMMMGWLLLTYPGEAKLPSTYHTPWLYIHIGFGKVFLGAVLVAVGMAGAILLRELPSAARRLAGLPASPRLDELAYRFMALGLVFETLMLIAGAIWAQDSWGRYWAWDPLETWAFLTWLMLAGAIHARLAFKIGPRLGAMLVLATFCLAFLTFFGVPFISQSAHKGAV